MGLKSRRKWTVRAIRFVQARMRSTVEADEYIAKFHNKNKLLKALAELSKLGVINVGPNI